MCRCQRRSDGLRHVRRSGTAETAVERSPFTVVARTPLVQGVLVMHPVVVASVMAEVRDLEAGEEDGRDDEHDAGNDHDPGRESVEPVGFYRHGRRLCGDGGRPGWGFWCFTHT